MLYVFSAHILRAVAPYETPAPAMLGKLPSMILYAVLPYEMAHMRTNGWNFWRKVVKNIDFSKKCPGKTNAEGSKDKLLPIDATY